MNRNRLIELGISIDQSENKDNLLEENIDSPKVEFHNSVLYCDAVKEDFYIKEIIGRQFG